MSTPKDPSAIISSLLQAKPSDTCQYFIRVLTQCAVHKLAESASRAMAHSKSQSLQLSHIEIAIQSLELTPFLPQTNLIPSSPNQDSYITFASQYSSLQSLIKHALPQQPPQLSARWAVIDDYIPATQPNKQIKRVNKLPSEQQQSKEKFNIIHDTPLSFFMPQELNLFKFIYSRLYADKEVFVGESWNIVNMMPFLMNVLMTLGPSNNRVKFLLQIVRSWALANSLEYYLHQIFGFLIQYEGRYAWEVGMEMSRLIGWWQYKYPHFHGMFEEMGGGGYSGKIKRLAYEVYFRARPKVSMVGVMEDVERGEEAAVELVSRMNMCWLRFKYESCEYHEFFGEGRAGLMGDVYLDMSL